MSAGHNFFDGLEHCITIRFGNRRNNLIEQSVRSKTELRHCIVVCDAALASTTNKLSENAHRIAHRTRTCFCSECKRRWICFYFFCFTYFC